MTTIGVLFDTHGNYGAIEKVMPILETCDLVFHLGDRFTDMQNYSSLLKDKLICVKGNCDFESEEGVRFVEVEGKKLMLTHGHLFGVKYSMTKLSLYAKENGADAVFFGHTHSAFCEEADGILYVNPGAFARTKAEKSFAYVNVVGGKILCKINRSALASM